MKPEHVFLTGDMASPIAKVIDFGISKIKDPGGANLTKTGVIMGTPAFMAPEQARGEEVDQRADVYAVGAILYNLVTGKRPFDKNDPTATITAVLLEEPERPSARNPAIPPGLELVIQQAMAKNADDRYPTMKEFDEALAPFDVWASLAPREGKARHPMRASFASQTSLTQKQRAVELSRPMIVLFGGLATVGVVAGLLTFVGAVIRVTRGSTPSSNVTETESLIIMSLLTLALATPAAFAFFYVKKQIWNNTAKTVELADVLRRTVTLGFLVYGLGALAAHLFDGVVLRSPTSLAWPYWDLVLTALAGGAAAIAWLAGGKRPTRAA